MRSAPSCSTDSSDDGRGEDGDGSDGSKARDNGNDADEFMSGEVRFAEWQGNAGEDGKSGKGRGSALRTDAVGRSDAGSGDDTANFSRSWHGVTGTASSLQSLSIGLFILLHASMGRRACPSCLSAQRSCCATRLMSISDNFSLTSRARVTLCDPSAGRVGGVSGIS